MLFLGALIEHVRQVDGFARPDHLARQAAPRIQALGGNFDADAGTIEDRKGDYPHLLVD